MSWRNGSGIYCKGSVVCLDRETAKDIEVVFIVGEVLHV